MNQTFIAKSPSEIPDRDILFSMSGLEYMQAVLRGEYTSAPICDLCNTYLHHVEDGEVAFRGAPQFENANLFGAVHGGWYGTILDSCMACAVMTKIPKGSYYTTLEYKVNIVRSIPLGTEVEAVGRVQHSGRSTGVAVGELRGVSDGRLYATGSTTCIIMTQR